MSKENQNQESRIKNHGTFQVSQKAVLYDPSNKKFLLVKEAEHVDSVFFKKYGPWDIPGGRVDDGEQDLAQSLSREIQEETGLIIHGVSDVISVYRAENTYGSVLIVGYLALYEGGEITLSEEHTEYAWVTAEETEKISEYRVWLKQFVKAAGQRIKEREYLNDLKRLQADFDNYRKRQAENQKELAGYLIEKLVIELIPVLDNFQAATAHVPETSKNDPWVTGIQYIEKQLENVLAGNGVVVIEAKGGDVFDPTIHEAVSSAHGTWNMEHGTEDEEPSSANATAGKQEVENTEHVVVKVLQKGYKLGERVIKPAKVTIRF